MIILVWALYFIYLVVMFLSGSHFRFSLEWLFTYFGILAFPIVFGLLGKNGNQEYPLVIIFLFSFWGFLGSVFSQFKSATNFYLIEPGLLFASACVIIVVVHYTPKNKSAVALILSLITAASISFLTPGFGN